MEIDLNAVGKVGMGAHSNRGSCFSGPSGLPFSEITCRYSPSS